jgi:pimeloyl-ACP methyl ester carboxylesterase
MPSKRARADVAVAPSSSASPRRRKDGPVTCSTQRQPVSCVLHSEPTTVRYCASCECDVQLAYSMFADSADSTDDVVVMIGALNGSMMMTSDEFCIKLAESGPFRVLRYDNRDVGRSTKMEHRGAPACVPQAMLPSWLYSPGVVPYTLEDMADDCAALLQHLNIEKAHIAGSSMGGMISQLVALRHPERVLSLSSLNSSTSARDLPPATFRATINFLRRPKSESLEHLIDYSVGWVCNVAWPAHMLDDAAVAHIRANATRQQSYSTYRAGVPRQLTACLQAKPRDALLGGITVPALVMHGAHDILFPLAHGERTAKCIPDSRFVVLADGGHVLMPATVDVVIQEMVAVARRGRDMHARKQLPTKPEE